MQRVSSEESPPEDTFIAVTGITDVPTSGTAMASLTLTGTVSPANATNQAIVWSVKTGGGTGASISGNSLSTTNAGTVIVTATIANGATAGTDYAQDFNITINPPPSGTQMSRTISGVSVPFRYVPAGSFLRDGTAGNVTIITKGYWMGETTVTQELFQAVMGVNPSYFDGSSGGSPAKDTPAGESQERRPVENVSWYDAIAFCNKLSLVNGKDPVYSVSGINWATLVYSDIPTSDDAAWNDAGMDMGKNGYRLPTDMEWMWAAMGADTANPGQPNTTGWDKGYAGSAEGSGQTNLGDYAWYAGNSGSKTHEVGKKAANELELYDLSGNVWEYCWDWFVASIDPGTDIDPTGPTSGPGRVNRGGVWHYPAGDPAFRVARRVIGGTYDRIAGVSSVGFRVVCGQ
jgi:formylglycine-generating enzyme required for sulfatase activity